MTNRFVCGGSEKQELSVVSCRPKPCAPMFLGRYKDIKRDNNKAELQGSSGQCTGEEIPHHGELPGPSSL